MTTLSRLAQWLPLRALVSRRWLLSTLAVLAGMAVLVRLGLWQLDRLEQRQVRNAAVEQQLSAPPLDLNVEMLPADPAAVKNHRAIARGEFDSSQAMALILQEWQGQPGVHLVVPLILPGRQEAVLVDRGWIPFDVSEPAQWSQFEASGTQTVTGFLQLSEVAPRGPSPVSPEGRPWELYRVDIDAIQQKIPYPLLPLYLLQTAEGPAGSDLPRPVEPQIDLSEGRHLGYAVQFFLFALILGVGYARTVGKRSARSMETQ